ncbi:MAG: efflux transporter outer membrane subunit [Syntrophobacteraceae bacterium]|jgi:NodT family efflux transporter outer membrane factor (OMF) lipoprotein
MARLQLIKHATIPLLLAVLSACTVGPDYLKPKVETPASYKEVQGWKKAEPQDNIPRGPWWTIYNDRQLNALEEQVNISNQNLAAAEAQYRQALALVQVARSAYFPTATIGPSASRSRTSANAPGSQGISQTSSDFLFSAQVSWQPDLWGKVRRQVESSKASAQASDADLEGVRLTMHGQLAQDYFQLRTLDSQKQLLTTTVDNYRKFLALTKNRYATGVAGQSDVLTAQTQLETAETELIDTGVQRAQLEHAIAVLMGKAPSDLTIPATPLDLTPPAVPAGIPSGLLERRPDIAAAERQAAAANALIGVAEAAYYPNVTLSATGGFEASSLAQWFLWPSRFWTLGPAAVQETLLDGGLRRAQTEQARAAYDASVATYRQTVLAGFQQVEDNLAALRILEQEAKSADAAADSAKKNVVIIRKQYEAGTASALDVIVVQAIALNDELTAVNVLGRRLNADVLLVEALGGGWSTSDLPSDKVVGQKHYKGFPW